MAVERYHVGLRWQQDLSRYSDGLRGMQCGRGMGSRTQTKRPTLKRTPKTSQAALQAGLEQVEEFLQGRNPVVEPPGQALSQLVAGDDVVELDRESLRKFHEIRQTFERYAEMSASLTVQRVLSAVEHAVVDHFGHGDLKRTKDSIVSSLRQPVRKFTVYVPVLGLHAESLPGEFGGIPILPVEDVEQRICKGQRSEVLALLKQFMALWPRPAPPARGGLLAIEVTEAAEGDAARDIALRRARELVDVLHFFADGASFIHAGLWVAEPRSMRGRSLIVSVDTSGDEVGATPILGGLGGLFSLQRKRHDPAWDPVNRMLASRDRTEVESLILTSMGWSGRATREPRREVAFTQFAIALEALLLPRQSAELTERLATRVARLMAPKLRDSAPLDVYSDVKRFYAMRSKIVHDGTTEISNVDLFGLDSLTKWVTRRVVRVCLDLGLSKRAELDEWLVDLVVGGATLPESG